VSNVKLFHYLTYLPASGTGSSLWGQPAVLKWWQLSDNGGRGIKSKLGANFYGFFRALGKRSGLE